MTLTEARRFVERAEKLPVGQIDKEKLEQAVKLLTPSKTAMFIGEWPARAQQLLARVMDEPATTASSRSIPETADGRPGSQFVRRTDAIESRKAKLDPVFLRRFKEAADGMAIPQLDQDRMISEASAAVMQMGGAVIPGQGQMTVEDLLEAQVEEWELAIRAARGAPIGVPESFIATPTTTLDSADRSKFGGRTTGTAEVKPRYFEGDQLSPAGLPPEQIARIQQRLVNAGLMEPDTYWAGFWDAGTTAAYQSALGYANQSGRTVDQAIDRLIATLPDSVKEQRARAQLGKTFQADPFIKPDAATLAQDVKAFFRGKLGRDPRPDELAAMTSSMGADYRAAYDVEQAANRAAFDAEQAAVDKALADMEASGGGTDAVGITGSRNIPVDVGSFTAIDPAARFAEAFDRRYGPEIKFREGQEATVENMGNVFASLSTMSSMIR